MNSKVYLNSLLLECFFISVFSKPVGQSNDVPYPSPDSLAVSNTRKTAILNGKIFIFFVKII